MKGLVFLKMSKPNVFRVSGHFIDENCNDKNKNQITFASSQYNLNIEAEDMKKAYDIALEYMPAGAEIVNINLEKSIRYCQPNV